MPKPVNLALVVVGILLLVWGISSSESLASESSELLTGAPTDKSMWLIVGGALATIVGGVGILRRAS